MGHLLELTKLNLLVYGNDELENYRNNTIYFTERYRHSDDNITAVRREDIKPGRFHFLHYMDDSKWMMYSPVFVVDHVNVGSSIALRCVNLNYLPLRARVALFDPFIKEKDFDNPNFYLRSNYETVDKELKKYGYQWALMSYNLAQVKLAHRIGMSELPRFLYSGHKESKYNPAALSVIWKKKIVEQDKREQEMRSANMKDFFDITGEIDAKYELLKGHMKRMRNSIRKYGGR